MKQLDQKVLLVNLPTDNELDGRVARVKGVAHVFPEFCTYIVQFDKPLSTGYVSIAITEHCLEDINF